ncbi:MAG: hypothetical protein J1E29_04925 [Duncaniella sp.]|nr:hypothetical protein [Duncaniella sp.]
MKKFTFSFLCGLLVAMLVTSCASMFTKSSQEITFKGLPGTRIHDPKKNAFVAEVGQNGFATAKLRKQLSSKKLDAYQEGYETREVQVDAKFNPVSLLNIIFGGIPGFAIDAATGKMMSYSKDIVDVTLIPMAPTDEESVIIPRQTVTRDNPGVTDMEKTIVRWFFDSDPRGCRVFYRVISNIPDEVKNTNETYLTTTPLEETKSFNIQGLTYENANDVIIEIKVSKRGFEDQVKRYNVRQALDQQEISGFFEMVPKE